MSALETLQDKLQQARTGDADKQYITILQTIVGELSPAGKEEAPEDSVVYAYLVKNVKNIRDNIEKSVSSRRPVEKIEKLKRELDIAVLLKQEFVRDMSEEDILSVITDLQVENPDWKVGQYMKYFKDNFAFQYDPRVVTDLVKGVI